MCSGCKIKAHAAVLTGNVTVMHPLQITDLYCSDTGQKPMRKNLVLYFINVKKTYQFKNHCKDDVMMSLH